MPRVVHFEIHAESPERAAEFYRKAFGWEVTKWPGPMEYWLVKTGEAETPGIDGGIAKREGPRPAPNGPVSGYVCTVEVENLEARLANVLAIGATMALPEFAVPGVGWAAYCRDTEGNLFGMMENDPTAK